MDTSNSNASLLSNTEDENSIIIWYQENNSESVAINNNENNGVNEDFIEIDLTPDSHESISEIENNNMDVPSNSVGNMVFTTDVNESSTISRQRISQLVTSERIQESNISLNPNAIDDGNETESSHESQSSSESINENSDPEQEVRDKIINFQSKLLVTNQEHVIEFCKTLPISCYIEGLVFLLKLFNRLDGLIEKFVSITNKCTCMPRLHGIGSSISWSRYIMCVSGANCEQCSMDFILHHLNNSFLTGLATASFITTQQLIDEIICNKTNHCSTSSSHNSTKSSNMKGWFRPWAIEQISKGCVISIIYQDSVKQRSRNKIAIKLVRGYDDQKFHLTMTPESMTDNEIESVLLREEVVCISKCKLLECKQEEDDFDILYNQADKRFEELNVIGQVIGTFRRFQPEEYHPIRIPNMHRNGILIVQPTNIATNLSLPSYLIPNNC